MDDELAAPIPATDEVLTLPHDPARWVTINQLVERGIIKKWACDPSGKSARQDPTSLRRLIGTLGELATVTDAVVNKKSVET